MQNEEQCPSSDKNLLNEMSVIEPYTGIEFPQTYNGLELVGLGVRVKYVVVKASTRTILAMVA